MVMRYGTSPVSSRLLSAGTKRHHAARPEMTLLPSHPDAMVARLTMDERTARRLSETMAEILPADEVAISAFELDEATGQWALEFVFETATDEAALRALISTHAGPDAAKTLHVSNLQPKDWVAASLAGLAPVSAGRFLLHGAHDRARVPHNRIAIEIEAALAFGTGHHGTTRGCLLAFDDLLKRRRPAHSLDIGTGTGVLAIAAARALHRKVLATDIDPIAVRVARENARRNRTGHYLTLFTAAGATHGRFRRGGQRDVIFANILAAPLKRMAAPLSRLLAPHGVIILSGLLPGHANAIIAAYGMQGLRLERRYRFENWVTLVMRRGR
jgi:ribosomal protein L11 methyltransferase